MTTKTYPVRLEPDLLEQANLVFKRLGLTKAAAIRVFLTRVVADQALPFELNHTPNALTRKALDDAKQGIGMVGPFKTVNSLMAALHADMANDNDNNNDNDNDDTN